MAGRGFGVVVDTRFIDVFWFDYGVFGKHCSARFAQISQLLALFVFYQTWSEHRYWIFCCVFGFKNPDRNLAKIGTCGFGAGNYFIDNSADSACRFARQWCASLAAFGDYEFSTLGVDETRSVFLCGGFLCAQKRRYSRRYQRHFADGGGAWDGVAFVAVRA